MSLQKIPLSNGPYGAPIMVTNTAITTGTTVHISSSNNAVGQGDEVVLYACNFSANSHVLSLSVGAPNAAATTNTNLQVFTISSNSTVQVMAGILLANTLGVFAASDTANTINITGYVVRSS